MPEPQDYLTLIADMEADPQAYIEERFGGNAEEYHRKLGAYQRKVSEMVGSGTYATLHAGGAPLGGPSPETLAIRPDRVDPGAGSTLPTLQPSAPTRMDEFRMAVQQEDPIQRALDLQKFPAFPEGGSLAGQVRLDPEIASASKDPLITKPPTYSSQMSASTHTFVEPSLQQAQEALRPYIGERASALTADSPEVKRYADAAYAIEYARAQREDFSLSRPAFLGGGKEEGWAQWAARGLAGTVLPATMAGLAGAGSAATLGGTDAAISGIRDLQANQPTASAIGEVAGYMTPQGAPGRISGAIGKAFMPKAPTGVLGAMGSLLGASATGAASNVGIGAAEDAVDSWSTGEPFLKGLEDRSLDRGTVGAIAGPALEALGMAAGAGARALGKSRRPTKGSRSLGDLDTYASERGVTIGALGARLPPAANQDLDTAVAAVEEPLARAGLRQQSRQTTRHNRLQGTYYESGPGNKPTPATNFAQAITAAARKVRGTGDPQGPQPFSEETRGAIAKNMPRAFDVQLRLGRPDGVKADAPEGAELFTPDELEQMGNLVGFMERAQLKPDAGTRIVMERLKQADRASAGPTGPRELEFDEAGGAFMENGAPVLGSSGGPKVPYTVVATPRLVTAKQLDEMTEYVEQHVNLIAGTGKQKMDDPLWKSLQIAAYKDRGGFKGLPGVTPDKPIVITGADGEEVTLTGWAALKRRISAEKRKLENRNTAAGLPAQIPEAQAAEKGSLLARKKVPDLTTAQKDALTGKLYNAGASKRKNSEKAQHDILGSDPRLMMLEAANVADEINALMPGLTVLLNPQGALRSGALPLSTLANRAYPWLKAAGGQYGSAQPPRGAYQALPFGAGMRSLGGPELRGRPTLAPLEYEAVEERRRR